MSGIKDQDRIEKLRKRLYERGNPVTLTPTHKLEDDPQPVKEVWNDNPQPKPQPSTPEPELKTKPESATPLSSDILKVVKKRRSYRIKMVVIGLLFFVISVGLSSIFLIQGTNVISGDNIDLAVTGPFTVGGGEIIPIQVGITNDNGVPIQSATLIVDYPEGTRSVGEDSGDLFSERLSLDTISPGETLNIPLRAAVFGEENTEQEINVSVEYRVAGSNALFFKEAEPLQYKISSTPIRLSAENNVKIFSGQETDVTVTLTSNSPTPLSDVVIKADYPTSFEFVRSDPDPSLAQNMWLIEELEPEETITITLTGIFYGQEADEYALNLSVGVPAERNPQNLASVFATKQLEFQIEQSFINVDLMVNNEQGETIVVPPNNQFTALVELENSLQDTIYDAIIKIDLSGNAISKVDIDPRNGYYNSSENIVTWDVGSFPALEEITPGQSRRVTLTITPSEETDRTPQVGIDVSVSAKRVSESQSPETLVGAASTLVKLFSAPTLASDVGHNNSVFSDSGPVPPEADTPTTYTLSFMIENGSNEITDAEVTASLPPYLTWLDQVSGSGEVSFNPVTRVIAWKAGTVEANASVFTNFQVRFLPSQNQIGTTPTILGEQRLSATDRFTGSAVTATNRSLTSEIPEEAGLGRNNGRVAAE